MKTEFQTRDGPPEVESKSATIVLWAFAFLTLLVAIPALVIAALSYANMPDSSCPVLSANTTMTVAPGHAAAEGGSHGSIWTYSGERGPDNWGKLSDEFKTCDTGKRQSPINIKRTDARADQTLALSLSMFSDMGKLLDNDFKNLVAATNNGHAVGVADASGFFTYQNVDYKLLQFHFHTPSEHRLDDALSKAEVHLVHQSAAGKYLVVGFLIEEDVSSPAYWGPDVLDKFPKSAEDSPKGALTLDYKALLQGLLGGEAASPYWTYSGSFTTPPCTEEVTWLVSQKMAKMSADHIKALQAATGVNNRPIRPLNDRVVYTSA